MTIKISKRWFACGALLGALLACPYGVSRSASAQIAEELPPPSTSSQDLQASQESVNKEAALIEEVIDPELIFRVDPTRSRILRTRIPITRLAITNPNVVDVTELSPMEIEVVGVNPGETTMTLWFQSAVGEEQMLRYLVKVGTDEAPQQAVEAQFMKLETRINELFPNSRIQLIPVADKIIVRGDARDAEEAAQILAVLGGQSIDSSGNSVGSVNLGQLARLPNQEALPVNSLVSLLRVPGEHQVMLKVRIAEINREAVRELGLNFDVLKDNFQISSTFGGAGNITAILDGMDVSLFIRAFSSNGVGKVLAEPTLVTMSGQTANFIAGGEFAVPTTVGVDGVGAVATDFYGFGTQLAFTPSVIDKDKIRLSVAPSFSTVNPDLAVNGIPGLNTRGATTTVELREGQWLAIAGLIQDTSGGRRSRVPYIGDIPVIGAAFGQQNTERSETELVILVSPELVHPLEPEQMPLFLPGMDVTEPTPREFFWHQQIEGLPEQHFRSTIWPAYRHQHHHLNREMRQAYREAKASSRFQSSQDYYMHGPQGFSK